MQITGSTRLTGLFGFPVKHTISPKMHNAAFKQRGLDILYLPFCIQPNKLKTAVKSISALGFLGINVTVPYKRKVIPYLDKVTPAAELIGAVNTILVKNDKLIGYNTDGIGFVRSLEEDYGYNLKGKTMFLLGAGGAGRAVAIQSALRGLSCVYIADTLISRAKSLAKNVPDADALVVDSKREIKRKIAVSDIIVNATPAGLNQRDPISIPAEWIPKGKIVYDLIYNPKKTKLLKKVKGCVPINGLGMLLYQGVSAFEIWTGKKAPVEIMRRAISPLSAGVNGTR